MRHPILLSPFVVGLYFDTALAHAVNDMIIEPLDHTPSLTNITISSNSRRDNTISVPGKNRLHYCSDFVPRYDVFINSIETEATLMTAATTVFNISMTARDEAFDTGHTLRIRLLRNHAPHTFDTEICKEKNVTCPAQTVSFRHEHYMSPIMRRGKIEMEMRVIRDGKELVCVRGEYLISRYVENPIQTMSA